MFKERRDIKVEKIEYSVQEYYKNVRAHFDTKEETINRMIEMADVNILFKDNEKEKMKKIFTDILKDVD